MNEAQAIALAEKHGAKLTWGGDLVVDAKQLAAMLTDHRAQVIADLAGKTGVMPEPFTHGGDENTCDADEVREALATMQAKLEHLQDIARCYEELRKATDGGSESMTHEDAVDSVKHLQAKLEQAHQKHKELADRFWKSEALLKQAQAEKEHYQNQWSDVCNENQGLLNKLEQAQADAARYRWLRDRAKPVESGSGYPFDHAVRLSVETPIYVPGNWGRDVDAAIDAAMKEQS